MLLSDKDLLARLVGFDSTSSRSNVPIADFVCDYLHGPGVTVERHPGPADAGASKVNVIAIAGPADAGGGLTLSGHLDVVPADEAGWDTDPFKLTEVEQRYVGRGTCDMKGSIALAVNLFAGTEPRQLGRALALLLTFDEELGSLGAQHFVQTWPANRPLPANVVVGEPTSLRAVRMHKGHLCMRITVHGTAAHSGSPHLGHNAIEAASHVVQALIRLAEVFKQTRSDNGRFFEPVPFTVLNVGRIAGGQAVNVIPDRCVIDVGIRLLPGMDTEPAIEQVREVATNAAGQSGITVEVRNNNPPMLLDGDATIHRALCELLGQEQTFGVSFASDAGVLSDLGMACVLFGPGSIEAAHKPNEFVPIGEFTRARKILDQLVARFCLGRIAETAL